MKKNSLKSIILSFLFTLIIFQNHSEACHLSSFQITNGPVDLGGGNYQYTVQICTGTGGTAMGFICELAAVGNTQNYNIVANGTSITGTSNTTITSAFNGIMSTSSLAGGILYYNAPSPIYMIPSPSDACDVYGPATQWCWNVTFVTSGIASSLEIHGLEEVDNGQGAGTCPLVISVAGINEQDLNTDDLIIFPNPSSGIVSFSLKNATVLKPVEIKVFNALGILIYSKEFDCSVRNIENKIDLGNFAKGAYFIEAVIDNGSVYKKIILS